MFYLKIVFSIVLTLSLFGCTPAVFFGGVTGSGATLSKEKTVGSSIDDYNIWTKIKAAFLQHHKEVENILTNISVEVSEGRVLLTGYVNTPEERIIVLKLVWEQNGVREVLNEIKIKGEDNIDSVKQYGSDSWITAQIKSKMLLDKHTRSINYNIETINGTVYILGIARTHEECEAIIQIVNSIQGVKHFVNYIRTKDDGDIKQKGDVQIKESKEEKAVLQSDSTFSEEQPKDRATSASASSSQNTQKDEDDDIQIEYIDSDGDID